MLSWETKFGGLAAERRIGRPDDGMAVDQNAARVEIDVQRSPDMRGHLAVVSPECASSRLKLPCGLVHLVHRRVATDRQLVVAVAEQAFAQE